MSGQSGDEPNGPQETENLASGIFRLNEYKFTVPKKKEFLPWHKPRKQFVRHEQWCYYIGQLLDELPAADKTLTYFGLPGVDLLDLRCFGSSVCEPRSAKLRFLGFNNGADPQSEDQSEFNISWDEVSNSPSFDPQSEILSDDIRQLVDENSVAWRRTFEIGPFDVINLDLCDGFGAQAPGQFNESYYNMMTKLLAVQARRKSPWLLLLTTRVGKNHVHPRTLDRLSALFEANLSGCTSFQAASKASFRIADLISLKKAQKDDVGIQPLFLVGLCKWLLKLAAGQNPPSATEVKSVLGYRVLKHAKIQDMVSIAIRFDPTHGAINDPINLASIQPTTLDECDLATKALKKVADLLDVDEYLESEKEIFDEMAEAMCKLLDAARYDVDEYRKLLRLGQL